MNRSRPGWGFVIEEQVRRLMHTAFAVTSPARCLVTVEGGLWQPPAIHQAIGSAPPAGRGPFGAAPNPWRKP